MKLMMLHPCMTHRSVLRLVLGFLGLHASLASLLTCPNHPRRGWFACKCLLADMWFTRGAGESIICFSNVAVWAQIFKNDNQDVEVKHKRFVLTSSWKPESGTDAPALVLIGKDTVMLDPKRVRQLHHMLPTRNDKKAVCRCPAALSNLWFAVARIEERHSWGCGPFFWWERFFRILDCIVSINWCLPQRGGQLHACWAQFAFEANSSSRPSGFPSYCCLECRPSGRSLWFGLACTSAACWWRRQRGSWRQRISCHHSSTRGPCWQKQPLVRFACRPHVRVHCYFSPLWKENCTTTNLVSWVCFRRFAKGARPLSLVEDQNCYGWLEDFWLERRWKVQVWFWARNWGKRQGWGVAPIAVCDLLGFFALPFSIARTQAVHLSTWRQWDSCWTLNAWGSLHFYLKTMHSAVTPWLHRMRNTRAAGDSCLFCMSCTQEQHVFVCLARQFINKYWASMFFYPVCHLHLLQNVLYSQLSGIQ